VDAIMCYKQKCKVVSLNLAHPVYGLSNGHVTDDVTWPRSCCEAVRSAILSTAWLLVNDSLLCEAFRSASYPGTAVW